MMSSIPCNYYAFPDVVTESHLSELSSTELRRRIAEHEVEIAYRQKAIAQYRGCLNALEALINVRLPPELLSKVFMEEMLCCTDDFREDVSVFKMARAKYLYAWFRVASVCRHWRSIVLSTPQLFSRISLNLPLNILASQWLSYSKQVPLQLAMWLDSGIRNNSSINTYIRRAVSLKVFLHRFSGLSPAWPTMLSQLKSLSIICDRFSGECPPRFLETLYELLTRSPDVRVLSLHLPNGDCMPHIPHRFLSKLRISVESSTYTTAESNATMFISLIKRLPYLDDLELDYPRLGTKSPFKHTYHPTPTLIARPLSRLKVTGPLELIMPILTSGTIAPRILNIEVVHSATLYDEDIEYISSVLIAIPNASWHSLKSTSIRVHGPAYYSYFLKGWSRSIPSNMHGSTDQPAILDVTIKIYVGSYQSQRGHSTPASYGSKLTLAFMRALSSVESTSVDLADHSSCLSNLDSIVTHAWGKPDQLRDFQMPVTNLVAFKEFLTQFGRLEVLSHLSTLSIVFHMYFSINILQDLRTCLIARSSNGGPRLDMLVMKLGQSPGGGQSVRSGDYLTESVELLRELVGEVRLLDSGGKTVAGV
ncbi:hypothetical protein QCA50_011103 [Cerrena zonata]|uniref:F-box domain-containing protein n=1 Tax=Cerrena zonata TaxID=2478898 RepID=A0AAW0G2N2_9APHY